MSSRRLLVLVKNLPEESAFKTAANGGDWPLQSQLITGLWNEVKALRTLAFHDPYRPVLSPSAQQEVDAKRALVRAGHDDVMSQLRGEKEHVA